MFGFELWVVIAAILTICAVVVPFAWLRARSWTYRLLMTLGFASLVWGVLPVLGGGGISPYLVVGAIIAFGFLILADLIQGDGSRW